MRSEARPPPPPCHAYCTADTLGTSLNRVVNRGERISNFGLSGKGG